MYSQVQILIPIYGSTIECAVKINFFLYYFSLTTSKKLTVGKKAAEYGTTAAIQLFYKNTLTTSKKLTVGKKAAEYGTTAAIQLFYKNTLSYSWSRGLKTCINLNFSGSAMVFEFIGLFV